ncbi:hypothetical protein KY284_020946 [Solanum tuberosum]|nr:hypothetical protein KY284_020946 [Solanum tuberosum]
MSRSVPLPAGLNVSSFNQQIQMHEWSMNFGPTVMLSVAVSVRISGHFSHTSRELPKQSNRIISLPIP